MEHISLSCSNSNESKLISVRKFISTRLSPFDLKLIIRLNNHEGCLEVSVNKGYYELALSIGGEEYREFLMKHLSEAWKLENEFNIKIIEVE